MHDNWALIYAQQLSNQTVSENNEKTDNDHRIPRPLAVVFNLVPSFLNATKRQYAFMLKGLKVIENQLKTLNIPFFLLEVKKHITNHKLKVNKMCFLFEK
jgi:deoxyribodipyrimidine photo-lyase